MNATLTRRETTPKRVDFDCQRRDDAYARDHNAALQFLLHSDALDECSMLGYLESGPSHTGQQIKQMPPAKHQAAQGTWIQGRQIRMNQIRFTSR